MKDKSRGIILTLAMLVGLTAILGGCDYLEKRRIQAMLGQRTKGLETSDASVYLSIFSSDYRDNWLSYDHMSSRLGERLKRKPGPVIAFGKTKVEIDGDRAVVTEGFTLEDRVQGRSRTYSDVQHLLFERRSGGWTCVGGSKVLSLLGGRMIEEHEIERSLLRREKALVEEDIRLYMSLVSPDYSDEGEGPDEIREKVLQIFRVYDEIEYRSFDREIFFHGSAAGVEQSFSMSAIMMGASKTFSGAERFELIKTEDGWKFSKCL